MEKIDIPQLTYYKRITQLSQRWAKSWAKKWEAGRIIRNREGAVIADYWRYEIGTSEIEELESEMRIALIAKTPFLACPLYAETALKAAYRLGAKRCRAYLYRSNKGREKDKVETVALGSVKIDDLPSYDFHRINDIDAVEYSDDLQISLNAIDAYWMASASRKWRSQCRHDRRLCVAAYRAAEVGTHALDAWRTETETGLRLILTRLFQRVRQGETIMVSEQSPEWLRYLPNVNG